MARSDALSIYERPDAVIWDEVVTVILSQEFAPDPDGFDVTVRSGIVTLGGSTAGMTRSGCWPESATQKA